MNKGITILILFAVLGAMGLVLYSHTRRSGDVPKETGGMATSQADAAPAASAVPGGQTGTPGGPLQAPQGGNSGLKQIDPPLTSGRADGAPAPVRLTVGNAGAPAQAPMPPAASQPSRSAPPALPGAGDSDTGVRSAGKPGQSAPDPGRPAAGKPSGGSPELTPWGAPSSVPGRMSEASPTGGAEQGAGKTQAGAPAKGNEGPSAPPAAPSAAAAPAAATPATPPAREPALSDKDPHVLKDISMQFAGQNMLLRIEADTPFPCRAFVLNNPDRMVIDLPGVWKGIKAPNVPQNRLIRAVRTGAQPAGPRIVLDLSGSPRGHKMQRNGNVVEILVQ
jgi:hypothetical protein